MSRMGECVVCGDYTEVGLTPEGFMCIDHLREAIEADEVDYDEDDDDDED